MCCPHRWAETATVLLLLSLHACAVTALKDYQLIRDFANPEDGINYRFCDAATRNASPCEARHRSCLIAETTADSTTVVCGPCQLGYIRYGFYDDGNPLCAPIDTLKYPKYEHRFGVAMNDVMKTEQTYTERAEVLKDAARFIASHNNQIWVNGEWSVGNDTDLPWKHREFMLGLTPYSADSTPEDYRSRSGYVYVNVTGTENELKAFNATKYVQSQNTRSLQQWASSSQSLPDRFDWVEQGGVTHVKDQGRCGCCWAISLSGAIEGGIYADPSNNGYLQSLSFQQFISCSKVNDGCGGGNLALASVWSKINIFSGIASLNDYPYTDYFGKTTEECLTSPSANTVTVEGNSPSSSDSNIPPSVQVGRAQRVAGFDAGLSQEQRIQAFKEALLVQPVGMVMKSACRTLSSYRRGVITDDGGCACEAPNCLDHAVLMVGYDDSGPVPYFKLKNSWGTMWGEDGYFRVAQSGGVGSYGLFGILAEGVVATGQNTTAMVEENIQQSPLKEWYTILILVLIGLCCLSFILAVIRKHCWRDYSSKEDRHLDDVSIDAEQAATR